MRALTTEKERAIKMRTLRPVSKLERILFPIVIAVIISLLLPSAAPLIGCLMLGNLMKECGVVDRLSKTVQNELMNIVVIFLGLTVGATATAEAFLNFRTLGILVLGVVAFAMGTSGGLLLAKLMNLFCKGGEQDQSADRLGRRVGRADGCPRVADRGSEGRSVELPADARDGAQRGRRRGLGRGGGYPALVPRIVARLAPHMKGPDFRSFFVFDGLTGVFRARSVCIGRVKSLYLVCKEAGRRRLRDGGCAGSDVDTYGKDGL